MLMVLVGEAPAKPLKVVPAMVAAEVATVVRLTEPDPSATSLAKVAVVLRPMATPLVLAAVALTPMAIELAPTAEAPVPLVVELTPPMAIELVPCAVPPPVLYWACAVRGPKTTSPIPKSMAAK
jgi:hypothetical protein